MDNLIIYLIKVSIGICLLYLTYIFLFSRDTFYLRNRIFLIGTLLLSLLIPFLKVLKNSNQISPFESSNAIDDFFSSGTVIETTVSEKMAAFDINNLLIWIYFSISGFFLLILILSLIRTKIIIHKGTIIDPGFPRIILSESDHPPFSFFPYIVIPRKTFKCADYSQILKHENAHITQGHTFDLLLTELIISFLWFNPFVWLIKRSIILNHEYLADNISIKGSSGVKEYQYALLNLQTSLMRVPLAHNYSSLIKNRIIMINKKSSPNYAALKNIIILPVVAILFTMFSFKPDSSHLNTTNQEPLFSKSSNIEILKFFMNNTVYPQEAKNSNDTGTVYIVIKIKKGGIIKECKAFTDKRMIKVPILNEVVVTAYSQNSGQKAATSNAHQALKNESLRVANKLYELKIPEWQEKDMEFSIPIKFTLVY